MKYSEMNKEQLLNELKKERERYNYYQSKRFSYDMTRGKPAPEQLELSNEMCDIKYLGDFKEENGFDCRNYGILDGLPEVQKLMGDIMECRCIKSYCMRQLQFKYNAQYTYKIHVKRRRRWLYTLEQA